MISRKLAIAALVFAAGMAAPAASLAGVADSPLPVLTSGGSPALLAFMVPGVMRVGNLETEFTCTSLTSTPFKFAVEVFGPGGGSPLNDVTPTGNNGTAPLNPGATQTIATGSTNGLHEDVFITGLGTIVKNGSARIVSESKAITCNAYVVDKFGTMRCGGASTNPGAPCTSDANCTNGGTGSCRVTPDSMLALKLISRKQKGD